MPNINVDFVLTQGQIWLYNVRGMRCTGNEVRYATGKGLYPAHNDIVCVCVCVMVTNTVLIFIMRSCMLMVHFLRTPHVIRVGLH